MMDKQGVKWVTFFRYWKRHDTQAQITTDPEQVIKAIREAGLGFQWIIELDCCARSKYESN